MLNTPKHSLVMAEDSSGGALSIEKQLHAAVQEPAADSSGIMESIESSKATDAPVSQVTDVQWRAMSDVLMNIYNYREQEYVHAILPMSSVFFKLTWLDTVAMTLRNSFRGASTSAMYRIITT